MPTDTPRVAGKLGRLPNDPSKPRLLLTPHLTGALPPAPPKADWLSKVPSWTMAANDRVGDCVFAAASHMIRAFNLYSTGKDVVLSDDQVLAAYSAVTGYNPADPSTDQGTVIQDALNYWRKTGIAGHKIVAFAQVDHTNPAEVDAAVNLFGALMVGVNFPASAMQQFNNHQPWTVANPDGGNLGGHAVHLGYYDTTAKDTEVVTWGAVQKVDDAWWAKYVEELWVVLTPEWADANSKDPQGLDLHSLGEDFAQLTGQPNPFPAPAPSPTPPPQPSPTPAPPAPTPTPQPPTPNRPDPADMALIAAAGPWSNENHWGQAGRVAHALRTWRQARGL